MHELPERENANPADFAEKVPKPTSKAYTSSGHSLKRLFEDQKLLASMAKLGLTDDEVSYLRALVAKVSETYPSVTELREALKNKGIPKCFNTLDADTPHDVKILNHFYMGGLYGHM